MKECCENCCNAEKNGEMMMCMMASKMVQMTDSCESYQCKCEK